MATDPFDDLLELENDYYREGYDAGVADSTYAGMIEGKVFGIEKGYEKALELGKLHGRALVWRERSEKAVSKDAATLETLDSSRLRDIIQTLSQLSDNTRFRRHVEGLYAASDGATIAKDNSDEAVTEFDDRITKAKAKAKVIGNIVGESLNSTPASNVGIEDATGLQARH
ncbi:uncharacterized protein Z520_02551 [Fonsecaea multimorphosa CBS 102226]|uniref:Essential protein Yae1 N-terminal domain-containing protein n=1 Tax=Fonsecaea multimorphosa CBS 102226 TaxID=1442371 RepID=A0A0D2K8P8_9EURO|nr:uncharacterized protein Z520_02551 [Fonsecaea multimorphosa CBS 102226]KIY02413.1 hypothetical protein Z520_02551 [Fonsecaea multimorphosa CBS 102226]OAL29053.1 hypothetical protein AYO22_02489 [Fonsecaea multimorphosa]